MSNRTVNLVYLVVDDARTLMQTEVKSFQQEYELTNYRSLKILDLINVIIRKK